MEKIRVGMIGAGETGLPLVRQLLAAPFVELVGIAELQPELPALQLARAAGVPVTDNFIDLAEQGPLVDILIDVTGTRKVREDLRRYLQFAGNTHTVIMHERVARLLLSLSAGHLVGSKHPETGY